MRRVVVAALLVVGVELIHATWLVRLPLWGAVADPALPLVVALAFRRPLWGALIGLAAGWQQDLLFGGSLGLLALSKMLIGQGAALLARTVLVDQPLLPWAATGAATIVHQFIVLVVVAVAGLLPVSSADLGRTLLAQIGLNLIAAWPIFALVRWVMPRRPATHSRRESVHHAA